MKNNYKSKGFTLVEILVAIAVIAVLASIVLVAIGPMRGKARDAKRKNDLAQIGRFLAAFTCYTPQAGPGEYDLADLFAEVKTKYPQAAQFQLPKDPKTGSDTISNYRYQYADENRCILFANLENEDEEITLQAIADPTAGYGMGTIRSSTLGVNGTGVYYQYGK